MTDDDGDPTHNEGLKVELYSEDEEMNAYLTEHPANYHITGSYEKLAKYTGYVDFSDGKPVDRTITGTFGAYLNGAKIAFDGAEVDKKL